MKAEDILDLLPSIQYALLCYTYDKLSEFIDIGNETPNDNYCECFIDAVASAADLFDMHYSECYEVQTLYVSFESMMEYYRLCRIHSRQNHIRLRDDPYVKDAERFVEDMFDFDEYGGYCVDLKTKVNHKWASGLVIRIDVNYFNNEFLIAEAVFAIGAWYEIAVRRLRKELLESFAL